MKFEKSGPVIVFPSLSFYRVAQQLAVSPETVVRCPVGINKVSGKTHYLVRALPADNPCLVISATERVPGEYSLALPLSDAQVIAHLALGTGAQAGRLWGLAKTNSPVAALNHHPVDVVDSVLLPGAGMHKLQVSLPGQPDASPRLSQTNPLPSSVRWSRTIGALGGRVWQRLTSLHIGIVGCGRTGSLIAVTLARMGVRQLTLVDPDLVEEHNLGEMDGVTAADIGRNKAAALADFLQEHCASNRADTCINAVAEPITAAHRAALAADILFACVDNDAARLTGGLIATLFHKVLIDVGTGIHSTMTPAEIRHPQSPIRNQIMGADIRLILPADGCLVCFGKLANYEAALAALAQGRREAQRQWWEQRNGSLRTLNMLAASVAVQMLCDLLAERLQSTTWMQLQYDRSGALHIEHTARQTPVAADYCPLCQRSGFGLDGIFWNSGSPLQPK